MHFHAISSSSSMGFHKTDTPPFCDLQIPIEEFPEADEVWLKFTEFVQ
jgi:hypothetical protein